MIVTFCGHRDFDYNPQIMKNLHTEIERLILQGADTFYLGGYGNFDNAAALIIKNLKRKYSHIKSVLIIPYINMPYDKSIYDYSLYPPLEKVPKRLAISRRNEWLVKNCAVLICFVKRGFGGAAKTFEYGKKLKIKIIEM